MSRMLLLILGVACFAATPVASAHRASRSHHPHKTILAFHTMYGVDGPFVGDANPVDDIPGDDLPWEIRSARGRLDTDGRLLVVVRGLVFKDDPSVPPELRGKNDEAEFRAAVSCLSEEGDDVVRRTIVTGGFPATETGDSVIRDQIELPEACIAPAIFVLAGSEDKWFSVTGFEAEEEEEE